MANEVKPTTFPVLGVDVSKRRLDAALMRGEGEFAVAARCDLCLEPSGGYELELCDAAHGRGHRVLMANAMRTANFRKSQHGRNKTDIDDARLLCEFALRMRLRAWLPPSAEIRQLKELVQIRGHLVKEAGMHRGLLDKAPEREADKIDAQIGRLLENTPEFAETASLLRSIPGVGPVTIAVVCSVGDVGRFGDVRQFAAFAGIHPSRRQSGAAPERARVCKTGDRALRAALFMAALSASNHNPAVSTFARKLRARRPDLGNKQIICACAHKLLRIVFGVLKSRKPFAHSAEPQSAPPTKARPKTPDGRSASAANHRQPRPAGIIARQVLAKLCAKTGQPLQMASAGNDTLDGC